MRDGPVLVGVDGSEPSEAALRWACQEAVRRGAGLVLVHAAARPWMDLPVDPRQEKEWEHARQLLTGAEELARRLAPELTVRGELSVEGAAASLVRLADDASLVVLGNRGHGGFVGLLVGSVASQVAGHAPCPVVLVKAEAPGRTGGPVVTGVGDGHAEAHLEMAFPEAALYGGRLQVVNAWWLPTSFRTEDMIPQASDLSHLSQQREQRLHRVVERWRDKYPEVTVEILVVNERPRHALVTASAEAALLVIGRHDEGGRHAMALGSVAHAVVHHANCPVMVVGRN